jgi:hypothetical protein
MQGKHDDTPPYPPMEGGVSVPFDPDNFRMWLITGRFDGVLVTCRQYFVQNLSLEFNRRFPNRSTFTGNENGYQMVTQATEEEMSAFLELYKRTVEIWGGDIRLSRKMLISDVGPV